MDNKQLLAKAKGLGLPTRLKATTGDYTKVSARQQSVGDPYAIIQIYSEAVSQGASWEDCQASAQYYYGMNYDTLMAVCWFMVAMP